MKLKFKFRMRTVLLVLSAFAVLFGSLAVKVHRARRQQQAMEALLGIGGAVFFDYQYQGGDSRVDKKATSPVSPFLLSLFGADIFSHVTYVSLDGQATTNDHLIHLRQFPQLRKLRLIGGKISAEGLANLSELTALESLSLGIDLTDEDLAHLERLDSLKELYLMGPTRDAHTLVAYDPNQRISKYYRYKSQVTRDGVERLGRKLSSCRITY